MGGGSEKYVVYIPSDSLTLLRFGVCCPVNTCLYETIRAVDVISFQAVTAVSTVFTAFKVLENFRLD